MTPDSIADLTCAIAERDPRAVRWPMEGRIAAAVCVPLSDGRDGLEVWCIKRPDGLRHHAREVAFPGGKPEPADRDLLETALRETEEELGIDRAHLQTLGELSAAPTATSRFTLHPYVVLVESGVQPSPAPAEVAALIRMPLPAFFAGQVGYRTIDLGQGWRSPIFDFPAGSMYGASAHIMQELLDVYARLHGLNVPEPEVTTTIPWM